MPDVRVSTQPPTAATLTSDDGGRGDAPSARARGTRPATSCTAPQQRRTCRASVGCSAWMPAAARWMAPAPTEASPATWAAVEPRRPAAVRPVATSSPRRPSPCAASSLRRRQNRGGRRSRRAATPSRYSAVVIASSSSRRASVSDGADVVASAGRRRAGASSCRSALGPTVGRQRGGVLVGGGERRRRRRASTSFHRPHSAVSAPVTTRPDSSRSAGAGDADEAGQHPAHPVLGRQPELRRGGRDLRRRADEAQVAEQRDGEADAGGGAVDRGDQRRTAAPNWNAKSWSNSGRTP